jgi:hypothetical protein
VTNLTVHRPFGIRASALQAELRRRERAHEYALASRRSQLNSLQVIRSDLAQYLTLLQAEGARLAAEEQGLLHRLARDGAGPEPTAEQSGGEDPSIAHLQQVLHQYRTLQQQISGGVMALIGPFLKPDAEGGNPWPGTRTGKFTESGAP